MASNWYSTAAAHSSDRLKSIRDCIFSSPCPVLWNLMAVPQLWNKQCNRMKLSLNSVFLISLAVLKSNQAAGCQPPAHSVRNSDTEQCAGAVVTVWLPDAWFPWNREAVHGTLQQADSGESWSKEFGQGARSRYVCPCYLLFKVNLCWELMLCVLCLSFHASEVNIYKEPTWCNLAVCLLVTAIILYMFRTLFASILRST